MLFCGVTCWFGALSGYTFFGVGWFYAIGVSWCLFGAIGSSTLGSKDPFCKMGTCFGNKLALKIVSPLGPLGRAGPWRAVRGGGWPLAGGRSGIERGVQGVRGAGRELCHFVCWL